MSNYKQTTKYQTSPLKAIRKYCIECCGGQYKEVTLCTAKNCQLYPFRGGKNPYYAKNPDEVVIKWQTKNA